MQNQIIRMKKIKVMIKSPKGGPKGTRTYTRPFKRRKRFFYIFDMPAKNQKEGRKESLWTWWV